MSSRGQNSNSLAGSPVLVGAATVLCAVVAVFLSYNANNGLPFVPTYDVTVQVPDAAGLVRGNEVRIGGKRVGVIEEINAVEGEGEDPISELEVSLLTTLDPLPADSVVTVRPRSPLGLKYLELKPGTSEEGIEANSKMPLAAAQPIVELDEVVNAFDSSSRRALRQVLDGVGPGFAGRGVDVNVLLADAPALLRGARRVAANVSEPATGLRRLLVSADLVTGELASVAAEGGSALERADTTAGALDAAGAALGEAIGETPPTQAAALSAFREARPLLTDAAALARDIRPGVRLLPRAADELDRALDEGVPVLRRAVALAARLEDTLAAVAELSEDPATSDALDRLLRVLVSVKPTLEFLAPAQIQCNYLGLWTRNIPNTISEGDSSGTWFRTLVIADKVNEALSSAEPAPDLHVNPYPHAGANGECEAGNEPWLPGQQIGNVPGDQGGATEPSRPPEGGGRGVRAPRNPNAAPRISNFAIGLLCIVLAFCACWLAFKGAPWTNKWELRAVVRQATELGPRSPVRIAGVEVGKVEDVEPGEGDTSIVTLALEDDALPIHEDATLKVRPRIFLEGNFFVDLKPGSPGAPVADEGHTLPVAQTAAPVQLDQILSTLQADTRANLKLLLAALGEGFADGGAQSLNEAWEPSDEAFTTGAIVAEAFRGTSDDDLPEFVDAGGDVAAAATRARRLPDLIEGLNRSSRALASRAAELSASLPELDRLLEEADPALDALNAAFPPTRALVRDARPGVQAAPETLELAIPVLEQARRLVAPSELPALLDQLDPAVRSLARLEPDLTELLGDVTPVTECLRVNAVPTLKKEIDDPPHSSGGPVYRELLYGVVGLASASQNFDGNGPAVRYHAGGGDTTVTTGRVPSIGESLVGLTDEPILGSRPRWTGVRPPFRPDVPCVSQDPPDLSAETGPAPQQERVSSFDAGPIDDAIDLLRVPRR